MARKPDRPRMWFQDKKKTLIPVMRVTMYLAMQIHPQWGNLGNQNPVMIRRRVQPGKNRKPVPNVKQKRIRMMMLLLKFEQR
jgi:hypothetical protein